MNVTGKIGKRGDIRSVLTISETAAELRISPWLAGELARRGEIPSVKLGGRRIVPRQALEDFLAAGGRRND